MPQALGEALGLPRSERRERAVVLVPFSEMVLPMSLTLYACRLCPASQNHWVQSYVRKYLLDEAGEASAIERPSGYSFDRARWIDWQTPALQ